MYLGVKEVKFSALYERTAVEGIRETGTGQKGQMCCQEAQGYHDSREDEERRYQIKEMRVMEVDERWKGEKFRISQEDKE